MIVEYHRPKTLEEALSLLAKPEPITVPLGGGTLINQPSPDPIAVVDLQALGLNTIESRGKIFANGATVTLQQLLEFPKTPLALKQAIRHEATYNLRQKATLAGALVGSDGRSPLATSMLAFGAELTFQPGDQVVALGDFLPLRDEDQTGKLITHIHVPNNVKLTYEYVARTPADLPIVCVAVAQWPSGRTRVALGGYGQAPLLALDGPEPSGAESAARDAYREAGDQWASAEYRREMAATLVERCVATLSGN